MFLDKHGDLVDRLGHLDASPVHAPYLPLGGTASLLDNRSCMPESDPLHRISEAAGDEGDNGLR